MGWNSTPANAAVDAGPPDAGKVARALPDHDESFPGGV
jgi:hypothetical protein